MRVEYHPLTVSDLNDAVVYYNEQRAGFALTTLRLTCRGISRGASSNNLIVVGMATLEIAGTVLLTEPRGRENQGQPERWTNAVFHGAEPSRECIALEPLR